MRRIPILLSVVFCFLFTGTAFAQISARMLRNPDVSQTHIAFVYAGDIWIVPKNGGVASRLSSPQGEESFPHFSPDGSVLAFSANYDGNEDVYTIPITGGIPSRLTHHPMSDRVLEWYPDGNTLLYASSMESGSQRFNQFYRLQKTGGLPEKLPIEIGEFGAVSPDGNTLAFTMKSQDFRTWKRYRGGWAPDIWLFDLKSNASKNVTQSDANESNPMWHDNTLYVLSDGGPERRNNIWAYNQNDQSMRQVTHFEDFDIHFPSIGPSDLVFEAGGTLYLMDLQSENYQEVPVTIITDRMARLPRSEKVSELIMNAHISPSGKRAIIEARGELFSLPAEHGFIQNLTNSSGWAERFPAWSPDGKQIACFSDRSGEYELTVRPADGSGNETTLTRMGPGFRYNLYWSPDSKKIAFVDQGMNIQYYDVDTRKVTPVDRGLWMFHGALNAFTARWSPDSRWLTFSREIENRNGAIFLYDTRNKELHQATSGYYSDTQPAFDPDGKYLYILTDRTFQPAYGDIDNTWIYPNTTNIAAIPLRMDVESPLAPRNDEEGAEEEQDEKPDSSKTGEKDDTKTEEEPSDEEKPVAPVEIDLDGFEERLVVLPPRAGNYNNLSAASGKVVYQRMPMTGSGEEKSPLVYFDLKEREEKTILEDIDDMILSADGKKVLVTNERQFAIISVEPNQKMDKPLRTSDLEMMVDPVAEWHQIFNDAWRFERDFFYDPNMHGVDWNAMRTRYGRLIDDAATRWDVNYVLGELIAELNASHTYRGGGDVESSKQRGVALLGVDWALENGAYRIKRIVDGAPWDSEIRSPLRRPGTNVKPGDYVLAVNGIPLDTKRDPWAAFQGLAGQTIVLTVNDRPTIEGARRVLVEPLDSETRLRNLAWIESNRKQVEEVSNGRVGYIYVPSTGIDGQTELVRQFASQYTREALIIDERFNSGGQIPDRFIELLNRPALAFWGVRDGKDWNWPPIAHFGPKVMLINGWSGSGGDAFPWYFKKAGLGPLIGTRTWGGLIGISGAPPLIDGGAVTVPTFRMFDPDGTWFAEGHGVDPDIEVVEDPTALAAGKDPQLERAIQEALRLIEENPPPRPHRPAYEDRAR